MSEYTDDFGTKLFDVHEQWQCLGNYCTIHKPSDHLMRGMKQRWRSDRALMERVCEHGVGHPDPDEIGLEESGRGVHGCDGCCLSAKVELDAERLSEAANLAVQTIFDNGEMNAYSQIIKKLDTLRDRPDLSGLTVDDIITLITEE